MNTGVTISGLLILVIIFIWKMTKYRYKTRSVLTNERSAPLATAAGQDNPFSNNLKSTSGIAHTDIMYEEVWWKRLSNLDQLQLALSLCQKALPVWDKYTTSQDVAYHTSSTAPANKIDSGILQTALEEIASHTRLHFPGKANRKMNERYFDFVGPVVAIQDGDWNPPYPIKKIFLAVYYILKSIVEQNNLSGLNNFFPTSINQALDCMDIAKLFGREEITAFLEVYKNKL